MTRHPLIHNIWKLGVFAATDARTFISILSVYYLTIPDVTIQNVGWIFLIANISSFLFELPSGYISDKIGHRKMLIVSKALLALSTVAIVFADSMTLLVFAAVITSIARACSSGTRTAFTMETLKEMNLDYNYSKIIGRTSAYSMMVSLIFSAIIPFLTKISFTAPFILTLVLDIIGLSVVVTLKDVSSSKEMVDANKDVKFSSVIKEAKLLNFFPIALVTGFIFGTINGVQIYRGPYQEFVGADIVMFGVFFALGRMLASLTMLQSDRIKKYFKDIYQFELYQIFLFSALFLILGLTENYMLIIITFILINGMMWGTSQVRNHFYLEILRNSNLKASLLSVRGQFDLAFTALFSVSFGYLVDLYSYKNSFIILTVYFFVISVIMYFRSVSKKQQKLKLAE